MRVTSPGDGPRECWSEGLSVLRQAVDHCDGWRSAFPAPHSMPSGLAPHSMPSGLGDRHRFLSPG